MKSDRIFGDQQVRAHNSMAEGTSLGMGQAGVAIGSRKIPFDVAMQGLQSEIEELNVKIAELENRLSDYCGPTPASAVEKPAEDPMGSSIAIAAVTSQKDIVTGMWRRVAYLIDSLEI